MFMLAWQGLPFALRNPACLRPTSPLASGSDSHGATHALRNPACLRPTSPLASGSDSHGATHALRNPALIPVLIHRQWRARYRRGRWAAAHARPSAAAARSRGCLRSLVSCFFFSVLLLV